MLLGTASSYNAEARRVLAAAERPNAAIPSGSGEPPAEDAVAFSTWPRGWVGSTPRSQPFGEIS